MDVTKDPSWLLRLSGGELEGIAFNGGGTSLTLRVRFADGNKAIFKPDQRAEGSNYRAEIAAYHMDRRLGLGRVAPVAGRALSMGWIRHHLVDDAKTLERLEREVVVEGDRVWGAMIAWHVKTPTRAEPPKDWVQRVNPPSGEVTESPLAWSDMVLFDALIDNTDRWSGGNVMSLGPGGPLIFLDNASAFLGYRARRKAFLSRPLEQLCRFRRRTVEALRAVGPDAPPEGRLSAQLAASLGLDLAAPVLSPALLHALDERLVRELRHVGGCLDRFGEESLR